MSRAERARRNGGARPVLVPQGGHGQMRDGAPGETHLTRLAPPQADRLVLALMRWQFQTFAQPDSHGWLMALRVASAQVGAARAGALCYQVTALVQALRRARVTPIAFNPEGCACCRDWASPDERRLLGVLDALRCGQAGQAALTAQMLCDGAPGLPLIAAAQALLDHMAAALPDLAPGPVRKL